MMNLFHNRWLWLILRLVLGGIFLAASIPKIANTGDFVATVAGYGLLPDGLAGFYGRAVPWVELFTGCALVAGAFVRVTAALSLPLTLSFVAASSYALVKSTGGPCGCFGNFISLSHPVSLTIDVVMLLIANILIVHKVQDFLTIGQLLKKIRPDFQTGSPLLYRICLTTGIAALMGLTALGIFIDKLPSATAPEEITVTETIPIPEPFTEQVAGFLAEGKPVLVDVYAVGCAPCQEMAPVVEELEKEYLGKIAFIHIDWELYTTQAKEMKASVTPTFLLVTEDNGDGTFGIVKRLIGIIEKESFQETLNKVIP